VGRITEAIHTRGDLLKTLILVSIGLGFSNLACSAVSPSLDAPLDGSTITDVASFFRWEPVAGCSQWQLQIATDAQFQNLYQPNLALPRTLTITDKKDFWFNEYFPRTILPAGTYYWHVATLIDGKLGEWSPTWSVTVNSDHSINPLIRPLTPDRPVFLMRQDDLSLITAPTAALKGDFPADLNGLIVPDDTKMWKGNAVALAEAQRWNDLGIDFTIWNNRARAPLSFLEYCFQHFPHCLGTAEGEHSWSYHWERGPEDNVAEWDYVTRAFVLCGKYGRFYFEAEPEPSAYNWTFIPQDLKADYGTYHAYVVPMHKSTESHVPLHSVGAVEGMMLSGLVDNCGCWADQFVWPIANFGKLGELNIPETSSTALCPPTFSVQQWLVGIMGGATAFQLESGHQIGPNGDPKASFSRVYLPFVQAVYSHHLLPSRAMFLNGVKVAVVGNVGYARKPHHNFYGGDFAYFNDIYALKRTSTQEEIPNNARYGILPILPDGTTRIPNSSAQIIPEATMAQPGVALQTLDDAYPKIDGGDAFQWFCDGSVIITNSYENEDINETFSMPVSGNVVKTLSGTVQVHQYIVGKVAKDGASFWFQTNSEFADRTLSIALQCTSRPQITAAPPSSVTASTWDQGTMTQTMFLSFSNGPVECTVSTP
jgi:hypothetical protein